MNNILCDPTQEMVSLWGNTLLFDLENVIDAKTVATFKGYVVLTSRFQC